MESKTKKNISKKISNELKNKTVLVTGGAGSIGSHLVKKILDYPVKSVRVLDIDEHALFKLKHAVNDSRLRMLLGSILDKDRIQMAGNDVDIIIHTAAIKNIEISEYNPIETIKTNKLGTVVVFPSYQEHRITPVTKGTKYSLVVWFIGPPFV